jgi:hypothetical protein
MIRLAFLLAVFASCSHPPSKTDVIPGQVIVAGDTTFTTREGNAIDVHVTRALGEQQGTGAATLHGMTLEEARTSVLVSVAKGRAWLAIATQLSEASATYDAAMRGLDELGLEYRNVKRKGKYITDDSGQTVLLAKMSADKGDYAKAAAGLLSVLRERIQVYLRVFDGSVE